MKNSIKILGLFLSISMILSSAISISANVNLNADLDDNSSINNNINKINDINISQKDIQNNKQDDGKEISSEIFKEDNEELYVIEENTDNKSHNKLYLQDKILAVIHHPIEKVIITKSDLRPHLDGRPKTLDGAILNQLIILDAKALKFDQNVTEEDVDKILEKLQRDNNMTKEDFEGIFKDLGYDWEQGRQELKKIQLADAMMQYRIKDKIVVEKSEIQDYYDKNPMQEEVVLNISQTEIPFYKTDDVTREEKIARIDKLIEEGDIVDKVNWDDNFEINNSDLAEDKQYIKDLPIGSVVKLKVDTYSITLLYLKDKSKSNLVPFEKREKEITGLLRKQKYEEAVKTYESQLKEQVKIVYK